MNLNNLLCSLSHFQLCRNAIILLFALTCNMSGFCDDIHDAIHAGDLAKVKLLLKDNPELVSRRDDKGYTLLHEAAAKGDKDVVEWLIAKGAKVNAKAESGWRPLHEAAQFGNKDTVKLLLDRGANVNAIDKGGETPLHWAAGGGHKDVVKLLLDRGANVNYKDKGGMTPLHWAANRMLDFAKLQKGITALGIELTNQIMPTLNWAEGEYKGVVEWLIAKGARINAKDNNGCTPLHYAMKKGYKDVVDLLLANKAKTTSKNSKGCRPLGSKPVSGQVTTAEFRCQNGVNCGDRINRVPLCDLVHNPTLYEAKTVVISATYLVGFECSEIYCLGCTDSGKIWVVFEDESAPKKIKTNEEDRTFDVIFSGRFYADDPPYGHRGAYRYKFVVESIKKAKIIHNKCY
jgi:ankyrin repeat protein